MSLLVTERAINDRKIISSNFILGRYLNKLRWLVLTIIFSILILLPFLHLYQTYIAAHAYDLLSSNEKFIYESMAWLTALFTNDPVADLDYFKGTTWTGTLFGLKLSDPLAVMANSSTTLSVHWPLLLAASTPIMLTVILGRFFCGWICPATFIYELNDNIGTWLHKAGFSTGQRRFDLRLKYMVLLLGVLISAFAGTALFSNIYPPAIIGREIYYAIAMGGFGIGTLFFLLTLGFDLFVARRGFCRYVCPGGALYSILGRYRLLRIKREVAQCNDCAKCNTACQFGLDPMRDDFGQECNSCTACMAVCPTDTLQFTVNMHDAQFQGPGHLGQGFKREQHG